MAAIGTEQTTLTACLTTAVSSITSVCKLPLDANPDKVLESLCSPDIKIPEATLASWQAVQTWLQSKATTRAMHAAADASLETIKTNRIQSGCLIIAALIALAQAAKSAAPSVSKAIMLRRMAVGEFDEDSVSGKATIAMLKDDTGLQTLVIFVTSWFSARVKQNTERFLKLAQKAESDKEERKNDRTSSPRGTSTDRQSGSHNGTRGRALAGSRGGQASGPPSRDQSTRDTSRGPSPGTRTVANLDNHQRASGSQRGQGPEVRPSSAPSGGQGGGAGNPADRQPGSQATLVQIPSVAHVRGSPSGA